MTFTLTARNRWIVALACAVLLAVMSTMLWSRLFPTQLKPTTQPAAVVLTPAKGKLAWSQLKPAQQVALAPLQAEWDKLDDIRKQKWMQIAERYPTMSQDAQQRLQQRMVEWVRMTPEQRRTARENFLSAKSVSIEKKTEAWNSYQNLSEEQKSHLAAAEKARKPAGAVSAPPAQNPTLAIDAAKAVRHEQTSRARQQLRQPTLINTEPSPQSVSAPMAASAPQPQQ